MIRRPSIIGAVLAAFVTTTAVPGPQVISHSHTGGDHDHAHASLAHEAGRDHDHRHPHDLVDHHDDHDHDHALHRRHEAAHARRHRGHQHRPRLAKLAHDPLHHTHVASPFQPATPPDADVPSSATLIATEPPSALEAPVVRTVETVRSRGPPRSLLV